LSCAKCLSVEICFNGAAMRAAGYIYWCLGSWDDDVYGDNCCSKTIGHFGLFSDVATLRSSTCLPQSQSCHLISSQFATHMRVRTMSNRFSRIL
jgi:hypothetical protein